MSPTWSPSHRLAAVRAPVWGLALAVAAAFPAPALAAPKPEAAVQLSWTADTPPVAGRWIRTELHLTARLPVASVRLTVTVPAGVSVDGPLPEYDGTPPVDRTLTFPLRILVPSGAVGALTARAEVETGSGFRYRAGAAFDPTPPAVRVPAAAARRIRTSRGEELLDVPAAPLGGGASETHAPAAGAGMAALPATFDGHFYYRDRVFDRNGFVYAQDSQNPLKPIRYAQVDLLRNGVLALSGTTDGTGAYSFSTNAAGGDVFTVRIMSRTGGAVAGGPVTDIRVQGFNVIYSATSGPLQKPSTGTYTGDFVVEPGDLQVAGGGEAFNILDSCVDAILFVQSLTGAPPGVALTMNWAPSETVNGTYYVHGGSVIDLLGEEGYDDCVIIHEFGHYVAWNYSRDQSPGGTHYLDDQNEDPRLAWSEGWASYFQAAARAYAGDPDPTWYVDTTGKPGAGQLNFSFECEGPSFGARGDGSEVAVQATLWDVEDGPDTPDSWPGVDDDPLALPMSDTWAVLTGPMKTADTVTLEDFWDGWFSPLVQNGHETGMRALFAALGSEFYPDSEEADGDSTSARPLPVDGTPFHHTFYPAGDVDYHVLSLTAGMPMTVQTLNVGNFGDTYLEVFDPSGTRVAFNGNQTQESPASQVTFTAAATGNYLVKLRREFTGKAAYAQYGSYDVRAMAGIATAVSLNDVASAAAVQNPGFGVGVGWADYDGDGRPDLYLVNNSAPGGPAAVDALFRNQGNGTFVSSKTAAGLSAAEGGIAAAWGDYDNDGRPDLFLSDHGLFHNGGSGGFSDVTAASGVADVGKEGDAAWVDADNDGRLDLFVIRRDGPSALWHNDGDGTFTDVAPQAGFGFPPDPGDGAYGCAWADYDGDRLPDLFIAYNQAPGHRLFHNLGGNTFEDVTAAAGMASDVPASGATWGDVNGDGRLDLFVAASGPNALYLNHGNGVFTDEAARYGVNDPGTALGSALVDYDLDGDLDLFVVNLTGIDGLFQNLGGTMVRVSQATGNAAAPEFGCGWADYDGDGDPDLYVSQACGQTCYPNLLYRNQVQNGAAPRSWLQVKLTGVYSNRDGIGADIVVHAGAATQFRQLGTETGWASRGLLPESFGFPDGASVDSVEVYWPSGHYNVIVHPDLDRVLDVVEDDRVPVAPPPATPALAVALGAPFPNPFTAAVSVGFRLNRGAHVRVDVFDVAGRRVRTLLDRELAAGDQVAGWNGEDETGRPTAPGIYFYRFQADRQVEVRKLVRISR